MTDPTRSTVVITKAEKMDYLRDYVCLPRSYGTRRYEQRRDVREIRNAVQRNLAMLDERIRFTQAIKGKHVIIKPNLVTVFHHLGTRQSDHPETTDPRVLDAVVEFLRQHTDDISIVESSGRGMPTWASFEISGLTRLAKHRGVRLTALEEQPVDRYLLPRAKVMREIVIPRIFSEVVRGNAFYISVPKMKTNLYTGVTLGFKNAMGTIPYNLRQRNHTFDIDQKLVDMLHLFQPDLVIIDGIVGGEGNCPAPVDPVPSGVIISGNQAVETDRVATRMMGFDPADIPLMRLADAEGFGDAHVEVLGEETVTPFRPADPSLLNGWVSENFPKVRVLMGMRSKKTGVVNSYPSLSSEQLKEMELGCRGGCLATTRFGFEMLLQEGVRRDFALTVILGSGACADGACRFFDRSGTVFSLEDIKQLPGRKLAIGKCTAHLRGIADRHVDGCMPFPNAPHMLLHQMSGTSCRVVSLRNRYLLTALIATLRTCQRRKKLLRASERLDIPLRHDPSIHPIRQLRSSELGMGYIEEPFEPLTRSEIRQLCGEENRNVWATFRP